MRIFATLATVIALLPSVPQAHPLPGFPAIEAIELPADLSEKRREIVGFALESAAKFRLADYLFGSADPERGGFDCSGSVYYILRKSGIVPPRTSASQFDWIRESGDLVRVPADTTTPDDEVFSKLTPGDLLFWSGTYEAKDGRTNRITHVQMYLGKEKDGGRHVMIGSTDGRSYHGTARTGFGVYDFKLPRKGSKSRFVGYGSPPGIDGKPQDSGG